MTKDELRIAIIEDIEANQFGKAIDKLKSFYNNDFNKLGEIALFVSRYDEYKRKDSLKTVDQDNSEALFNKIKRDLLSWLGSDSSDSNSSQTKYLTVPPPKARSFYWKKR